MWFYQEVDIYARSHLDNTTPETCLRPRVSHPKYNIIKVQKKKRKGKENLPYQAVEEVLALQPPDKTTEVCCACEEEKADLSRRAEKIEEKKFHFNF